MSKKQVITAPSGITGRSLGNVDTLSVDISEPLKMDIKLLQTKQILLLLGANGTGKTFILKLTWVLATIINNSIILWQQTKGKLPDSRLSEFAQFYFDHTFVDNTITGKVGCLFTSGDSISVELDKGKITSYDESLDASTRAIAQPVFLSKEMRLFDDIVRYLKFKKMLGIAPGINMKEEDMKKLLEMYRIYDIIYVEQLLHRIENQTTKDTYKKLNATLKNFDDKFIIDDLFIDNNKADIFYTSGTIIGRSVTTLGAGHQSLLNTFLS